MIDRDHKLPINQQAKLLSIGRGTVYYKQKPVSARDKELMDLIDRLHLELPFAGARMLTDLLRLLGFDVGRRHVSTLMKRMGIEAIYRKPKTTRRHPEHKVYPYLLRGLDRYFRFYNTRRPHSSLDRQTPGTVYCGSLASEELAA